MRAKRTPNDVTSSKPSISNHMTLTWVAIGDLKAHGRKARTHSRDQISKIADSIKTFGFSVPIIVDDANRILAGHGRLEAARLLGMEKVPVVALSHLDEAQRRAFIITENRMAELAGWDRGVLKAELEELSALNLDFELEVIGFADAEIEAIVLGGHEEADTADKTPPPPETPTSREGDLWLLGDHRLLCGDALDPTSLVTVLAGEQARAVFTDPPYNVAVQGHVTKRGAHREFAMASGEMSDADFAGFLAKVWTQLEQGLAPGGLAYMCMDWRHVAHGDCQLNSSTQNLRQYAEFRLSDRLGPDGIRPCPEDPERRPADHVTLQIERVVDRSVRRQKPLRRISGLEPKHLSLATSDRQM